MKLLETLGRDVCFAWRALSRTPGFLAIAVLTLALGIGANTVMFSVVKSVLLRPLGFQRDDRLVSFRFLNEAGGEEDRLSWSELSELPVATQSIGTVGTYSVWDGRWHTGDRVEEHPSLGITPGLATTLALRPVAGRFFTEQDAVAGAEPVVIIGYEFWKTKLGGAANIVGSKIRLNEKVQTVIGILPEGLEFPIGRAPSSGNGTKIRNGAHDFWFPFRVEGEDRISRGARMFYSIGRLRDGFAPEQAKVEVAALGERWAKDHADANRGLRLECVELRDYVLGRTRHGVWLLAAAVLAVLLICCVNVANLLLARGVARQRELAVRSALGAGRLRIARSLLTEAILLAAIGGVIGIGFAQGALEIIKRFGSENVPFLSLAQIDSSVMAATVAVSILTALIAGFLPAVRQSRVQPSAALVSGTRASASREIRAWQSGLLIGQVALVVALLTGAALLLESFRRVINLDLGYQPDRVIAVDFSIESTPTNADAVRAYREVVARLEKIPGVEAVGTTSSAPLTGKWTFTEKIDVLGRATATADRPSFEATFIAFDYFEAMGIPLIEGRVYDRPELSDEGPIAKFVINEAGARRLFPGESAIGKRIATGANPERFHEVIGVVRDTRDEKVEASGDPRLYYLYPFGGAQVLVRTKASAEGAIALVRAAMDELGARVRVHEIKSMREIVSATLAERRFLTMMLASYAALALAIAAVGIFGVMAYQVAQRTNEFGIRMALGAQPWNVVLLACRNGARLVGIGAGVGILLSIVGNKFVASQVFGISPNDPRILLAVLALLGTVAALASFVPALRITRIDPAIALRQE